MKKFKYILVLISVVLFTTSCQDDDFSVGEIITPTNLQLTAEIVGADAANPNGDGSGIVNFTSSADNSITYRYNF